MNTTVDELFNFTEGERSGRRVGFGSQAERKMIPYHKPPTRIGVGEGVGDNVHMGPGTYSTHPETLFLDHLNKKPQSVRGIGFGASRGPRLDAKKKVLTPSPAQYQSLNLSPSSDAYKPFGSVQERFIQTHDEKKPKPGPGQYEHEVVRSRKPQCRESFGGQRTLIPTIATKCTGGEPDKCSVCMDTPVGDYFEHKLDVLCRKCYFYQLQSGEKFTQSYLMAFNKVRDCSSFHEHSGTGATIVTQPEKERKKSKQREAYFNLYFS